MIQIKRQAGGQRRRWFVQIQGAEPSDDGFQDASFDRYRGMGSLIKNAPHVTVAPWRIHRCGILRRRLSLGTIFPPTSEVSLGSKVAALAPTSATRPGAGQPKYDLFQQRLQLVQQPRSVARQLVLSSRHRLPQTLLSIGYNAQA
jgi:hypothetical protein